MSDRLYRFHWRDGSVSEGPGCTPEDAFTRLGYGAGAIAALDYQEEVRPMSAANRPADGAPSPQEVDIEMLRQMARRSFSGYVREDVVNALDRIGSSLRAVERERDARQWAPTDADIDAWPAEVRALWSRLHAWLDGIPDSPELDAAYDAIPVLCRALSPGAATTESERDA